MLQKRLSIGLFTLLLCHMLASGIVSIVGWWRAEHDLSEHLSVYRTVDSIVEFQVPLSNQTDEASITRTTEDGFSYRGRYYTVVSLEIKDNTLLIAGLETRSHSVWQDDLLAFLNDHLGTTSDTNHKSSQVLKFLLKEYAPGAAPSLSFLRHGWLPAIRIPDAPFAFTTRSASIASPPPKQG